MKIKLNGNDFYEVTSKFGSIDSVHSTPHTGLDLAMNIGTELNSPVDGVITKVVDFGSESIGKGIYIGTEDHQTVIMGHLSDIKAQVGQQVHKGDFVALSGSTGHSTGGHLHLSMKDASGHFTNPQPLTGEVEETGGFMDGVTGFMDFVREVKNEGLFHAIYGKSFFEVIKDFFKELGHDVGLFILGNGEVIFVVPAMVFMVGTWVVGRNNFTKWIIPLWIGYFVTKILYYTIK